MKKLLLFLADLLVLYASLALTLFLRYGQEFQNKYDIHIYPFLLIFALWLLVFYIANLYETRSLRNSVFFYSTLFQAIATAAGISVLFFYSIPFYGITPKTNLVIFVGIFTGLEFVLRYSLNKLFEKGLRKPVLIVGANAQALELARFIKDNPQLGYELAYVADLNPNTISELNNVIKDRNINTVVLSPEAYKTTEVIDLFYKSLDKKINFYNLSSLYEQLTGKVLLGAIDQIWFLENISEGKKRAYEFLKRVSDIILGFLFGTVSLVFYPFIVIAMQIDSPGPIFYKQTRIGRIGKPFQLIKFRNMIPNAEAETGAVWASDNDPRITRVGNFLRKTRLDEIPQLWTVVKGEISLVGPRAERPEFHDTLKKGIPFYEERYLIKPGLTGWAQINYRYGSSVKDAAEKLKYDLYYIKNRSIILDVGIILKTIRIMLQKAGK